MRRRMAQHPNAVSLDEARRVLEAYGWTLDHIRGSHHVFKHDGDRLVIPLHRPHIKAAYVKQIVKATESQDDDD